MKHREEPGGCSTGILDLHPPGFRPDSFMVRSRCDVSTAPVSATIQWLPFVGDYSNMKCHLLEMDRTELTSRASPELQ